MGIFDNETARIKWMVSGLDISRILLLEFKDFCFTGSQTSENLCLHHDCARAFKRRFRTHLLAILNEEVVMKRKWYFP